MSVTELCRLFAEPTRILVLDDDVSFLNIISKFLESCGTETTTCTTSEQAIEAAKAREFDMVFCDIVLQGETGISTAIRIHELRPDVPIVMMSGYGIDPQLDPLFKRIGLIAFISKPFAMDHTLFPRLLKLFRLKCGECEWRKP